MPLGGQGDPKGMRLPYLALRSMGNHKDSLWGHGADMETLKEYGDPMGSGGGTGDPKGF